MRWQILIQQKPARDEHRMLKAVVLGFFTLLWAALGLGWAWSGSN